MIFSAFDKAISFGACIKSIENVLGNDIDQQIKKIYSTSAERNLPSFRDKSGIVNFESVGDRGYKSSNAVRKNAEKRNLIRKYNIKIIPYKV